MQNNATYNVFYPQKGFVEQNPEEWWVKIVSCIKEITAKIPADSIKSIGIDGQSWSSICIDKNFEVLHNTPIWMDTRSAEICDDVKKTYGENAFFEISGNPFEPTYTLPKLIWFKKNIPDVYKNTYKVLQSNSFIAMKLTDKISNDYSQGYGLQCYDIKKREWNFDVLKELDLRTDLLPDLCESFDIVGKVTKKASEITGLKEGTPVVAGGLDAACGTLGAGVIKDGQTQEQGGQAGGMSICTDECISHKSLILSNHVVGRKWLLQGGTTGGGGVMNWYEKHFADYERMICKDKKMSSFALIDDEAKKVPVGSDGLIFLPYMAGERSPLWNPNAKGMYFGIDFSKTKSHFSRSAMEGVAFSLLHNLKIAENAGVNVDTLYAVGGAANSDFWTQMKADITAKKIEVPYSDTATTLGAVILAGVGCGIYNNFDEAVEKTVRITKSFTPNMENHDKYMLNFEKYLKLYESTKHLM